LPEIVLEYLALKSSPASHDRDTESYYVKSLDEYFLEFWLV
jgi:hypothetical protein